MRRVVLMVLVPNVVGGWVEVGRPERFGPISVLPSEGARRSVVVELVSGCVFHAPHELSERYARGDANREVRAGAQRARVDGSEAQPVASIGERRWITTTQSAPEAGRTLSMR